MRLFMIFLTFVFWVLAYLSFFSSSFSSPITLFYLGKYFESPYICAGLKTFFSITKLKKVTLVISYFTYRRH